MIKTHVQPRKYWQASYATLHKQEEQNRKRVAQLGELLKTEEPMPLPFRVHAICEWGYLVMETNTKVEEGDTQ